MGKKKKKIGTAVTTAALILALGLAGTFAWSGGEDSDGDIEDTMAPEVKLHDDHDFADTQTVNGIRNRDIYVENTGNTKLYIRVRLDEYMEVGGRSLIPGASKTGKSSWKPHTYQGGDNGICGQEFHDYFEWKMGNTAPLDYKSRVKNYYDDTTIVRDKQTGTADIISMKEYHEAQVKPADCWVVDTDGYAYWYTQLEKDTATGLLLDSIRNLGDIDETYYYGVNAKLEAVTESDLDSWLNGTAPTGSTTAANRATVEGVQFLKDISPSYVKITDAMNATNPKASDFDGDHDGYLRPDENRDYTNQGGVIRLDRSTFPDSTFRSIVKAQFDTDNSDTLTPDEVLAATALDVSNQGIENLQGVERLVKLNTLDCSGNRLTKLDLSENKDLTSVSAGNQRPEVKITYNVQRVTYESQKAVFMQGTTFTTGGNADGDITLENTGMVTVDNYVTGKTSDFSLPLSRTRSPIGTLAGTVSFLPNETLLDIDAVNFPDAVLRAEIDTKADKDGDHKLSAGERYALQSVDFSGKSIGDMKGLEFFPALKSLTYRNSGLTDIDLSKTPYLTTLDVSNNKLKTLDLSKNILLQTVTAGGQTQSVAVTYDVTVTKYKSAGPAFAAGTSFGNGDTTVDPLTGAVSAPGDVANTDTYKHTISYGNGKSAEVSGTVTYVKTGSLKASVKAAAVDTVINIGGTKWWVLTNNGTQAELFAKENVANAIQFHKTTPYPGWKDSDMRTYLNSTYYNTLSGDMKAAIKPMNLTTATDSTWTATQNTQDKVYLLASKSLASFKTVVTATGREIQQGDTILKSGGYFWWFRSPGTPGYTSAVGNVTGSTGLVDNSGNINAGSGVRPALTLNLQ